MSYNSPSIGDLLMAMIGSGRNVRTFRKIIREREFKRYTKESIGVTLSRLHKKGYLQHSKLGWQLTKEGKKYEKEARLLNYIASPFDKNSPISMIMSFDIPEQSRVIRNWLRNQIKIFGYTMLQQSLWVGPSPLPALFFKRLEDLDIRKNVKTFKITKQAS